MKHNLVEGKKEYVSALTEMNTKTKMLQGLLNERERMLESKSITPQSKETLTRLNNTIAGVQEMIRHAIRTQERAKEMILHAEKELGIRRIKQRAKKAA